MSQQERDNFTYEFIQARKRDNKTVCMDMYNAAIMKKLKEGGESFSQVEYMFQELHSMRDRVQEGSRSYNRDIAAYQKSILNIIRYAPTPAQAQEYATLLFRDVFKPFRTPRVEVGALANLIYVYGAEGSPESMREALDVIKLAMEIGVFEINPEDYSDNTGFITHLRDPVQVFENTCKRILRYHKLAFSADKTKLIPFK